MSEITIIIFTFLKLILIFIVFKVLRFSLSINLSAALNSFLFSKYFNKNCKYVFFLYICVCIIAIYIVDRIIISLSRYPYCGLLFIGNLSILFDMNGAVKLRDELITHFIFQAHFEKLKSAFLNSFSRFD